MEVESNSHEMGSMSGSFIASGRKHGEVIDDGFLGQFCVHDQVICNDTCQTVQIAGATALRRIKFESCLQLPVAVLQG